MKKSIAVFGVGGHGRVVIDTIRYEDRYEITRVFDQNKSLSSAAGLSIEHFLERLLENVGAGIVAVADNSVREALVNDILPRSTLQTQLATPCSGISR